MEQDKKLKNIIKTTIKKFLNEQIDNKQYKVGENIWYKNQYMDVPKLVKIYDIEQYGNEIDNMTIKFESGGTDRLLKYQFKYLSKEKQIKDDYTIVKEIGNQIFDIIDYHPNQIHRLFKIIKNNDNSGNFILSFTEEVKDGRTSEFDINLPMKLKGRVVGGDEFKFKIIDIEYVENYKQDSDYNNYINYIYSVTFKIVGNL